MLQHAFKEWGVVCRALAIGQQSIILRKGGISDPNGLFTPEHLRFWLFPTFVHQQADGVKSEAKLLLDQVTRPPDGVLRLTHFAEVSGVYHVEQEFGALLLDDMHIWSEATVRMKFEYRRPGLFVLPVRIFAIPQPIEVVDRPEYVGCKTWVELEHPISTDGAVPVLSDRAFDDVKEKLDRLLNPTMLA